MELIARAEALCRSIAPIDLADTPLYIVPQSLLPVDLGRQSACDGFTTPSLDMMIRHSIPDCRGRGPCMVVNDVALRKETDPQDFEPAFLAVVIHELAHILERPVPFAARTDADPLRIKFEALVLANAVAHDEPVDRPAFAGHEAQFIRLALHACHRATLAGTRISPSLVCAGNRYGLSHAVRYQAALGDEPDRLAHLTFREVCQIPSLADFAALWLSDSNGPVREVP